MATSIIDGDGHFVEPVDLWAEHVPSSMQDRILVRRAKDGSARTLVFGSYLIDLEAPGSPFSFGDSVVPGGLRGDRVRRRFEEAEPAGWDAQRRLQVHDENDILAAVLFPTIGLHFSSITEADVAVAACRAVNDWAAAYATEAPGELYVVASLPGHFPDLAAVELRRCVDRYGFVAAHVRPNPTVDGRRLDHPDFDVLWAAAEEVGRPVCVHNVAWSDRQQLGGDRCSNFVTTHAAVHPLEAMMAFATLYQGGIFDRYPRLRVGFMESGCGWAPFWLERLHEHVETLGWLVDPPLTSDPCEIFRDRCAVGCEGEEAMVPYVQSWFGEESVLWSSDFPHFDTEPPLAAWMVNRPDMTDGPRDGVLRRGALRFYGLDWDTIRLANARRRGINRA